MTWDQITKRLWQLGVKPAIPLEAAQQAGCNASHVGKLIAYFEAHHDERGWTEAALAHRIKTADPRASIEEGWPAGVPSMASPIVADWLPDTSTPCPKCGRTHRMNRRRKGLFQCALCVMQFDLSELDSRINHEPITRPHTGRDQATLSGDPSRVDGSRVSQTAGLPAGS